MRRLLLACLLIFAAPLVARAEPGQGWSYLGHGRLTVNDLIGDRRDRWRTGSVTASHVFGPDWTGQLPTRPGEILEFRLQGEIIAPRYLRGPRAVDRPYTQAISLGLHTHFERGGWEMAVGADAVFTGPQTGLSDLQMALHRVVRFNHRLGNAVLAGQTPNGLHASGVVEVGRSIPAGRASLRPFVELRAGVEDIARIGLDFRLGAVGQDELLIRDPVSGHRYRAVTMPQNGYAFVLGADLAHVRDSLYLPAPRYQPTRTRGRVRAGLHWQRDAWAGFYGISYLGPEFVGQPNGQYVGAIRLQVRF